MADRRMWWGGRPHHGHRRRPAHRLGNGIRRYRLPTRAVRSRAVARPITTPPEAAPGGQRPSPRHTPGNDPGFDVRRSVGQRDLDRVGVPTTRGRPGASESTRPPRRPTSRPAPNARSTRSGSSNCGSRSRIPRPPRPRPTPTSRRPPRRRSGAASEPSSSTPRSAPMSLRPRPARRWRRRLAPIRRPCARTHHALVVGGRRRCADDVHHRRWQITTVDPHRDRTDHRTGGGRTGRGAGDHRPRRRTRLDPGAPTMRLAAMQPLAAPNLFSAAALTP